MRHPPPELVKGAIERPLCYSRIVVITFVFPCELNFCQNPLFFHHNSWLSPLHEIITNWKYREHMKYREG